jgi:hypothetical protein
LNVGTVKHALYAELHPHPGISYSNCKKSKIFFIQILKPEEAKIKISEGLLRNHASSLSVK